jgi:hypothetical protein
MSCGASVQQNSVLKGNELLGHKKTWKKLKYTLLSEGGLPTV